MQGICAGFRHGGGGEGRAVGRVRAGVEQHMDDRRYSPVLECRYVANDGFHLHTVTRFDLALCEGFGLAGTPVGSLVCGPKTLQGFRSIPYLRS